MSAFLSNYALVSSMILSIVLGFLWYGPFFGKPWMRLSGIVMPDVKPSFTMMLKPMLLSLIGAFCMVNVLAFSIVFHDAYYQTSGMASALSMAILLWLGLIVPAYLNLTGWEGKPWKLFAINTGYWFVYLLLSASLIVWLS